MVALSDLVKANDFLDSAKKLACQCSGFQLQYEGSCQCLKGRRVKEGEATLARLISEIKKESESGDDAKVR